MSQQMFDEDHLPAVFNLHNQSVGVAFNVEHSIGIDKIGARVDLPYVRQVAPGCG
jgi:hypothetical protein